uniref:SMODS and SLOG-associating 2TM effector domain-containing protein n=1 Tax=viral metagenome TaxID=1070528 RepID=A0A6C0KX15_9ZZZZ
MDNAQTENNILIPDDDDYNENISENESKLTNIINSKDCEWSIEHEKILIEWADKAMCYRWLHSKSTSLYSSLNALYTIPCIIISTLAGTANFAQGRVPDAYQGLFAMAVGGINILGGIISTIQQFLKITQLNEAHRVSSIAWDKFYRNVKIELAKHPKERINVVQMIKMCKEEFDRLMETSPVIPDKIIKEFKHSFKKNNDFDKISKPEVCDVLVSTEYFRNPWLSDENKNSRDNEFDQIKIMRNMKKKHEKEKNLNTISDFKKTFYNLNNREPLEQEIIDNLSDKIDILILKKFIEENNNNISFKV